MPLELTVLRRVSLPTRISQCGYLARGLIGRLDITWDRARGNIEIVDRRAAKITSTFTVLSTPILFFLLEDWPLLQGR